MRFAKPAFALSAAPYARPTARVVSQSRGKLKACFFAKAALALGVSKLMPRIWAPFSSNWRMWSRNPRPSAVHPGVLAFG